MLHFLLSGVCVCVCVNGTHDRPAAPLHTTVYHIIYLDINRTLNYSHRRITSSLLAEGCPTNFFLLGKILYYSAGEKELKFSEREREEGEAVFPFKNRIFPRDHRARRRNTPRASLHPAVGEGEDRINLEMVYFRRMYGGANPSSTPLNTSSNTFPMEIHEFSTRVLLDSRSNWSRRREERERESCYSKGEAGGERCV